MKKLFRLSYCLWRKKWRWGFFSVRGCNPLLTLRRLIL